MVDLGEVFLLAGHTTGCCLGVSHGSKDGEVICSFADGTISLHDVSRAHDTFNPAAIFWTAMCNNHYSSSRAVALLPLTMNYTLYV